MTTIRKAIITPLSNQATAVNMSIFNGIPQCSFEGMATTSATGYSADPTHCLSNGSTEETIVALYEADPTNYQVKDAAVRGRPIATVLLECSPQLYPYLGVTP